MSWERENIAATLYNLWAKLYAQQQYSSENKQVRFYKEYAKGGFHSFFDRQMEIFAHCFPFSKKYFSHNIRL